MERNASSRSAAGLVAEGQARTRDDVRELMSGNICRCGTYPPITPDKILPGDHEVPART